MLGYDGTLNEDERWKTMGEVETIEKNLDGGWQVHQWVERKLVNYFVDKGYSSLHGFPRPGSFNGKELAYRLGITVMQKGSLAKLEYRGRT